eukprot:Platyproteum_vivax@DN7236_c0_g1_i1.p2
MNSTIPIDNSMIADYVRTKSRGKWNAIAGLATTAWSGSAILGGAIADATSYRVMFLWTAAVLSIALVVYFPLMFVVPKDPRSVTDVYPQVSHAPDAQSKDQTDSTCSVEDSPQTSTDLNTTPLIAASNPSQYHNS